jgi:ankyrin repeat protein
MAPMGSNNNTNAASLEELVKGSEEEISRALSTLMRFGRFESFPPILEKLEENNRSIPDIVLKQFDQGGHTLFHWAAKRVDDIRFLKALVELSTKHDLATEVLNVASKDNVGMRPIHWTCTEGSIPHAALLLKNGADMEARDNSGCTPLLIAAQYGQVEVVAYLLKKGANIQAVDSSRDTALHWAAYKGSIEVCGLLAYYKQLSFATQDTYGQTPLHLAALRGHTSVVRYILQRLDRTQKSERDVLFVSDKNQRTPLDLAIHKNRPNVEIVLKEAMAGAEHPRGHFFRKTLWSNLKELVSVKSWKSWMGMAPRGMDENDTTTKLPFYIVVVNLIIHFVLMVGVMAPFGKAGKGLLWDKSGLLMLNFVTMVFTWYFFWKTVKTSPGYVDDSMSGVGKWRQLYEETLESLADETTYVGEQKIPKERPFVSIYLLIHALI